ncbi:type III effector [Pseudomonas sp. NPDC090202]|uniref:type III effector n=1 Tax=unclassified Pseudomonas TaxID=196821 RepID=UPI003830BCB1
MQPTTLSHPFNHPAITPQASVHDDASVRGSDEVVSVQDVAAGQVRAIADYLKQQVFAAHYQTPTAVPRDVSREQLADINAHNDKVHSQNHDLDLIVDSRARALQGLGETPASIADTLAKGESYDRGATRMSSAFRGIPFASATLLQAKYPELGGAGISGFLKPVAPLIAGTFAGTLDAVGTGVMNRATADIHFLKAPAEQLHEAMADSLARHTPGLAQTAVDQGLAIQSYTARNLARTVIATALSAHPHTRDSVDSKVSAFGGLAANALFANRLQTVENNNHLRGGAYVFGRKDAEAKPLAEETEWLDAYRAIKDASIPRATYNGIKRGLSVIPDAATQLGKSVRNASTLTGAVQTLGALGGGFAAVGKLQEAATRGISNPYLKTAASQLTNAAGSAAVFAGWTTAGLVTDPASKAVEQVVDKVTQGIGGGFDQMYDASAPHASAGIAKAKAGLGQLKDAAVDKANTTGAAVRQQVDNLTRRQPRAPDQSYLDMA